MTTSIKVIMEGQVIKCLTFHNNLDTYSGNHRLLRVHQIDSLHIEEVGTDEDEISHVSNMKAN